MSQQWDEFSKSLAEESLPRRESLRRLGIALAGAVLSPLGLQTASAAHHPKQQLDPCKSFCKCRNKKQQDQCLKACSGCGGATNRLCGGCGSYVCCAEPGPNEYGACVSGHCEYWCADGAVVCDGVCTLVDWDPFNCGGCGNVCPAAAPYCQWGTCAVCPEGQVLCNGVCSDLAFDPSNCGGCGQVCPTGHVCSGGVCCNPTISDCFGSSDPCVFPFILCGGVCVDPTSDRYNCGGCGIQCASDEACISGFCVSG